MNKLTEQAPIVINRTTRGVPWLTLTTIVFIILKLTGTIAWSWWWVFAPLWIIPAFIISWLAIIGVIVFITALVMFIFGR